MPGTWSAAPRGSLSSVRHGDGADVRHYQHDELQVGASPEGFSVSPDGRYVAVANMRAQLAPTQ